MIFYYKVIIEKMYRCHPSTPVREIVKRDIKEGEIIQYFLTNFRKNIIPQLTEIEENYPELMKTGLLQPDVRYYFKMVEEMIEVEVVNAPLSGIAPFTFTTSLKIFEMYVDAIESKGIGLVTTGFLTLRES